MDPILNDPGTVRSRMQYTSGPIANERLHKKSLALLLLIMSHVLHCVFYPEVLIPVVSPYCSPKVVGSIILLVGLSRK